MAEGACPANMGTSRTVAEIKRAVERARRRLETKLRPFLAGQSPAVKVIGEVDGRRLVIRLAAVHFFDPASAEKAD